MCLSSLFIMVCHVQHLSSWLQTLRSVYDLSHLFWFYYLKKFNGTIFLNEDKSRKLYKYCSKCGPQLLPVCKLRNPEGGQWESRRINLNIFIAIDRCCQVFLVYTEYQFTAVWKFNTLVLISDSLRSKDRPTLRLYSSSFTGADILLLVSLFLSNSVTSVLRKQKFMVLFIVFYIW